MLQRELKDKLVQYQNVKHESFMRYIKVSNEHSINKIEQLLPQNWTPSATINT